MCDGFFLGDKTDCAEERTVSLGMRGSSNSREPKDPVPEQGDAADAVWGVGARALYRSSSRLASESLVASRARSGSAPIAVARWARSLPAESAADAAASPCATRRRRPTQVEVPHLALTSSSTIEVPAGTPRVTPRSPARQHTIDFSSGAGRAGSADVATAATGDDDEDDACGVCAQPAAAASAVAYTATLGFYSSPRVGRTLAEPLGGAEPCVVVERRMSVSNGRVAIEEVDTPTTTAMPPPPLLPVVSARSAPVLAESDTQDVAPSKLKDSSDKKRRKKKTKDKKEDKEKKEEKEEKEEHSHKHRHKHEKHSKKKKEKKKRSTDESAAAEVFKQPAGSRSHRSSNSTVLLASGAPPLPPSPISPLAFSPPPASPTAAAPDAPPPLCPTLDTSAAAAALTPPLPQKPAPQRATATGLAVSMVVTASASPGCRACAMPAPGKGSVRRSTSETSQVWLC